VPNCKGLWDRLAQRARWGRPDRQVSRAQRGRWDRLDRQAQQDQQDPQASRAQRESWDRSVSQGSLAREASLALQMYSCSRL
jgi:hypothetical protein